MSAENCIDTTRCPCPCLPKVTLEQAVVDLVESIALQENALSHILCAESRKMDAAMKLDGLDLCKLLEVNDSATNMVHAVAIWNWCSRISWSSSPTTCTIRLRMPQRSKKMLKGLSGCRAGLFSA